MYFSQLRKGYLFCVKNGIYAWRSLPVKKKNNNTNYPQDLTLAAGHQFPFLNTDLTKFDLVVLFNSIDITKSLSSIS